MHFPLSHRRHAALPVLLIPETKYKVTYAKVKISREPNSVGLIKLVSYSCQECQRVLSSI